MSSYPGDIVDASRLRDEVRCLREQIDAARVREDELNRFVEAAKADRAKLETALADARVKLKEQARQLNIQRESLEKKNRELDAMHWVWCSGSCDLGVHRWSGGAQTLTEEVVKLAERNALRLRAKLTNTKRDGGEHGEG